jgi:small-conductance mechanosensitive channel
VARAKASGNLAVLLGNAVFVGVIVLAAMLVLRLYGLDATALVAVLGIGTVAIGLALQDVLKNLFAGVFLLLEQPFRIGDTVVVDNREGEVENIDVRTTVLRMRDGTQALVPNAIVLATTVLNRTAYPARRVSVRLSGLTDDLATITGRVNEALREQPDLVPTPAPQVHVEAVSDGKTTVVVDLWRRADRDLAPSVLPALQVAFPTATVTLV